MVRHLAEKRKQCLYQFHFFLEASENKQLQRKTPPSTHTETHTAVCEVPTAIKGPCSTPAEAEQRLTRSGGFQTKRCILLIVDKLLQSDRQNTVDQPNVSCCYTSIQLSPLPTTVPEKTQAGNTSLGKANSFSLLIRAETFLGKGTFYLQGIA